MTETDFLVHFKRLGAAFDRNVSNKEHMQAEYLRAFQHLTEAQWQMVVDTAIRELKLFPVISVLRDVTRDLNLVPRYEGPRAERNWLTVACSCGSTFAVAKSDLPHGGFFKCPGSMGGTCGRSFSARFLMDHEFHGHCDFLEGVQ